MTLDSYDSKYHGLYYYVSNDISYLIDCFTTQLYTKETKTTRKRLIAPSKEYAHFIKDHIVKSSGIAMGYTCTTLKNHLENIHIEDCSTLSDFFDALSLEIEDFLLKLNKIQKNNEKSSRTLASFFEECASYYPEGLASSPFSDDEYSNCFSYLYTYFAECLSSLELSDVRDYEIHLFSVHKITPLEKKILLLISKHIRVIWYHFTPSIMYWGDTSSDSSTHSLFSFTEYGRDLFNFFLDHGSLIEESYFSSRSKESLLSTMQKEILLATGDKKRNITIDSSLSISSYSSPFHEIESLYVAIAERLEKETVTAIPRVYVSCIDAYAPFIKAIFGRDTSQLGYTIIGSDYRYNSSMYAIIDFVITLINSVGTSYSFEEILNHEGVRSIYVEKSDEYDALLRIIHSNSMYDGSRSIEHTLSVIQQLMMTSLMVPPDNIMHNVLTTSMKSICGLLFLLLSTVKKKASLLKDMTYNVKEWTYVVSEICLRALPKNIFDDVILSLDRLFSERSSSFKVSFGVYCEYLHEKVKPRKCDSSEKRGNTIVFAPLRLSSIVPGGDTFIIGASDDNVALPQSVSNASLHVDIAKKKGSSVNEFSYLMLQAILATEYHLSIMYSRNMNGNTHILSSYIERSFVESLKHYGIAVADICERIDPSEKSKIKETLSQFDEMPPAVLHAISIKDVNLLFKNSIEYYYRNKQLMLLPNREMPSEKKFISTFKDDMLYATYRLKGIEEKGLSLISQYRSFSSDIFNKVAATSYELFQSEIIDYVTSPQTYLFKHNKESISRDTKEYSYVYGEVIAKGTTYVVNGSITSFNDMIVIYTKDIMKGLLQNMGTFIALRSLGFKSIGIYSIFDGVKYIFPIEWIDKSIDFIVSLVEKATTSIIPIMNQMSTPKNISGDIISDIIGNDKNLLNRYVEYFAHDMPLQKIYINEYENFEYHEAFKQLLDNLSQIKKMATS